jgi:hypothetical protein
MCMVDPDRAAAAGASHKAAVRIKTQKLLK